ISQLTEGKRLLSNIKHILFILITIIVISYAIIYYSTTIFFVLSIMIQVLGLFISIYLLLFDRRGTNSKIAWIAVIFIIPIIGTISFLFFGRNPQERRFSAVQYNEMQKVKTTLRSIQQESERQAPFLATRIERLTSSIPHTGNDVTILTNGDKTFAAI